MYRISANNPVRRQLFPAKDEESTVDNFINNLQESIARDKMKNMIKWNFDFDNEVPLEGIYEWYGRDSNDPKEWVKLEVKEWIGVKSDEIDISEKPKEDLIPLSLQSANEATPKVKIETCEPGTPGRKRRHSNGLEAVQPVRKKLDYNKVLYKHNRI